MILFRSGAVLILSILLIDVARARPKLRFQIPRGFFILTNDNITWSVYPAPSPEVHAIVKNAIDFWRDHTDTSYEYKEISLEGPPARIRIHILSHGEEPYTKLTFTEDNKLGTNVARTIYDPQQRSGVVFITGYDTWKRFSERNKDALNMEAVLKHQLGYVLDRVNKRGFESPPNYNVTNISNLTKKEKTSFFFGIEVDDTKTVMKESYYLPQSICEPNFDAQGYDDTSSTKLFMGKYYYDRQYRTFSLVRDNWPLLPANLTKIDAFYADSRNFEVFFIGNQAYAIKNHDLLIYRTNALNKWLKSVAVSHVDFVFRYNTGMYVVSGTNVWKFNQKSNDDYTITKLPPKKWKKLKGNRQMNVEGKLYETAVKSPTYVTFDWLGFACQPDQKGLVPPECCNL